MGTLPPRLVINLLSHSGRQGKRTVDRRCPRHAVSRPSHSTMGDSNHTALTAEDDITVVFRTADSHRADSDGDHDECGDHDERTAERIHLRSSCRVSCDCGDGDARGTQNDVGGEPSPGDGERNRLCPGACCVRSKATSRQESAREGRRLLVKLP